MKKGDESVKKGLLFTVLLALVITFVGCSQAKEGKNTGTISNISTSTSLICVTGTLPN